MNNDLISFSFLDSDKTFEFKRGFSFVENKRLLDVLKSENYNNEESNAFIKTAEAIRISDVFQIKIVIKHIGYFLVNSLPEVNPKEKYSPLTKI